MTDLTGYLRARIAEDEEMATSAAPHFPGEVEIVSEVWEDAVAHIAHHDPQRVLDECAARRRTLERHRRIRDEDDPDGVAFCAAGGRWPCPDVLDVAQSWVRRPDFDPAWVVPRDAPTPHGGR